MIGVIARVIVIGAYAFFAIGFFKRGETIRLLFRTTEEYRKTSELFVIKMAACMAEIESYQEEIEAYKKKEADALKSREAAERFGKELAKRLDYVRMKEQELSERRIELYNLEVSLNNRSRILKQAEDEVDKAILEIVEAR